MTPKAALLKANIDADLAEIEKIYEFLAHYYTIDTLEQAILAGYYLNNLYSAFENICLNIAQTFEHQIDDRSRWHAALLKRMTLDIESIRPKLLSPATYTALDELRRFRHIRQQQRILTIPQTFVPPQPIGHLGINPDLERPQLIEATGAIVVEPQTQLRF